MSYVDWIDHHGDLTTGWQTKDQYVKDSMANVILRTHGDILFEDDTRIIMASEQRLDLKEPLYRFTTTIMKVLVVKVKR